MTEPIDSDTFDGGKSNKPEPGHYCAFGHREWKVQGLKDYGGFADCVQYCNQIDYGDFTEGEWYYEDPETLTIYSGSFGNYNSPGASSYTYADVFEEKEDYDKCLKTWQSQPEYLETDEDDDYINTGCPGWREDDPDEAPELTDLPSDNKDKDTDTDIPF